MASRPWAPWPEPTAALQTAHDWACKRFDELRRKPIDPVDEAAFKAAFSQIVDPPKLTTVSPPPPRPVEARLSDIEQEIGFLPGPNNPLGQGIYAKFIQQPRLDIDLLTRRVVKLEDRADDVSFHLNPPRKASLKERLVASLIKWLGRL